MGASEGASTKGLERQKISKALAKKEGRLPAKKWKPDRIEAGQAGNGPLEKLPHQANIELAGGLESAVTSLTERLNAISAED